MISAEAFLKILAEKDLVSSDVVRKLRKQVAESSKPIPAAAVAKRLIDKGYLTPALVKRLLRDADEAAPAPKKTAPAPEPEEEEEELGFAPTEEEKTKKGEEEEAERRRRAAKREAAKQEAAKQEAAKQEAAKREAAKREAAKQEAAKQEAAKREAAKREAAKSVPPRPTPPEKPTAKPATSPPSAAAPDDDDLVPYQVTPGEVVAGEIVSGEVVAGEVVMDAEPVAVVSAAAALGAGEVYEGGSLAPVRRRLTPKNFFLMFLPGRKRRRKENVWDSSLLLIGGGLLLVLVILGGALTWSILWQSGDKMVETADQLYRDGSYTQAIEMYDRFLNQFSTHEAASLARVRRGFCQMRQATDVTTDYSKALDVAKEVLEEIGKETAFGEAKPELQGMLTKIADGLAKQAQAKTDPTLVEHTREAVALIDKFVAKSAQNKPLMDDIEASLALTERQIAREAELAKAVAAMQKSIDDGKTQEGYRIRKSLLKDYPDLLDDARLREAILKVSAAEKASVKSVAEARAAQKPDPAGPVATEVTVACRTLAREAPGAGGHVIYVLAEGAAYGLDAATGKVLWRRFVGYQTNGSSLGFLPTPVAEEPGSDALLVDAAGDALARVEAKTGNLRWRQALGGRFDAHPVIDGNRVLVATVAGRLVPIDLATGDSAGFTELPQPLAVAPTVDAKRSKIYQVAEHSNLYVLAADGTCQQVVYLAHEPGSIVAAPVILSRLLVVAENRGVDNAVLRLFSLDAEDKLPAFTPVQEIELLGHVDASPLVVGAQLLVTTDQGWVTAFRLSGTETKKPLEKVAQIQAGNERDLVRFPLLVRDSFWIAGNSLTKYEIQSSLANFRTQWVACKDSAFRQPVSAVGETLFLARRRLNLPGMFVSAMAMDKPEVLWETTLAAPLVGEPVVGTSGRIEAVTALGAVVEVPSADVKGQSVVDQPAVAMKTDDLQRPIDNVLRTPDGLLALCTGPGTDQISVFDPAAAADRFRRVVLLDPLAAAPAAFAGGLLVPSQVGQVCLVDPRTGGKMVEPFQPELATGGRLPWRQPALVDENSVVVADGGKRIYRLGIKDQPTRHLAALDQVETAKPIVSPVAVVGNVAYAVDEAGVLQQFRLPKLAPGEPIALGGKPVWGPHRSGDHVFLATDDEQLLCLDGDGKLVWKTALLYGPLAGRPLPLGKEYLLASAGGVVSRVETATGKELGKLETGHPLGTGPVLLGEQILLSGNDGTLYVVSGKW